MTVEQVRAVKNATPFVPFRIHHADGAAVEVMHPDLMGISPSGRIAFVSLPGERFIRIDVALITALEKLQPASH